MVSINGHPCHETGCPEAWRNDARECEWCGACFTPEERYQVACDHSCYVAYSGLACGCPECVAFDSEIDTAAETAERQVTS